MSRDELIDALDGLFAYDNGSIDSGIHDEALRARCQRELRQLRPNDLYLIAVSLYGEDPYGPEDVDEFMDWALGQARKASR